MIDLNRYAPKLKMLKYVLTLVVLSVILVSGFYTVGDQERAVITTFGKYTSTQGAGLHFMVPIAQQRAIVSMITNGFTMGWQDGGEGRVLSNSAQYSYEMPGTVIRREG